MEGTTLSIDVNAALVYGYRVKHSNLTQTYHDHAENDFEELDELAQELCDDYAYELVTTENEYDEFSDIIIGIDIPTKHKVGDTSKVEAWHFEDNNADQMRAALHEVLSKTEKLKHFYKALMGHSPNDVPRVHLFTNTF